MLWRLIRVYQAMCGPCEFTSHAGLKVSDVTPRLGDIRYPTLVIGGRHDGTTPVIIEAVHRGIPDSEWVVTGECTHRCHLEEHVHSSALLSGIFSRVEIPQYR